MKAIAVKCPQCGAGLRAAQDAATVTCEYCGTAAVVQRRSRILEIARPVAHAPHAVRRPVARQRHSRAWVAIVGIVVVVGSVVPAILVTRHTTQSARDAAREALPTRPVPAAAPPPTQPRWDGAHGAIAVDLTGDGTDDVIGRVRVISPADALFVGAFDGATGAPLWQSESIGERGEVLGNPLVLAGETLVAVVGKAELVGLSARDGTRRWRARLDEKIVEVCAGPAGPPARVVVVTADERAHHVELADGTAQPTDPAPCQPLPTDRVRSARPDVERWRWGAEHGDFVLRDRVDGAYSREALFDHRSGIVIGVAHKDPGSEVPMLIAYRWPAVAGAEPDGSVATTPLSLRRQASASASRAERRALQKRAQKLQQALRTREPEILWRTPVPAGDPLAAEEGAPDLEHVAVGADFVAVAYAVEGASHGYRLTAFDLRDGRRRWDVLLPGSQPLTALEASATHVWISRWSELRALRADSGETAYTVP